MSYTERNTIICDDCGLFCGYDSDEYTPYGQKSYDPPEPLDPLHICKKCFKRVKKKWLRHFNNGNRSGDWQKSKAEMEAAEECGLAWVGSGGIGILGSREWANSHQYIPKAYYETLSKLPYYGWCKKCGKENKGGYCSDKKCSKSFKAI